MPGMLASIIRHAVAPMCLDPRNSSADAKSSTAQPDDLRSFANAKRSDSSASITTMMEIFENANNPAFQARRYALNTLVQKVHGDGGRIYWAFARICYTLGGMGFTNV